MHGKARFPVLSITALLAQVLACAALSQPQTGAHAPQPAQAAITRKILQTIEVPGSSYEVIEAKVEIAAGARVPRHTHPGTVVGYVLEGDYSVRLAGQPDKTVAPGETFVIPSGVVHEEFAGARGAKVIAVFTVEKGKPLTSPAA